jgi:acetaldehyde dehydrogenase (acetylating)
MKKIKIGILGSGNIGTDLLVKVIRSEFLECSMFVGRHLNSAGMKKASSLGVRVSDQSIEAFKKNPELFDIVFDATSAHFHKLHAPIFKQLNIKAIDMTPSQVGELYVPAININEDLNSDNINMITCGGQASIPIAYALKKVEPSIDYIETVSSIASRSAGPGTRANLDEYIFNTEKGLREFTSCDSVKAILNLNPAIPCIDMQTTIFAKAESCDVEALRLAVESMAETIRSYVPGYKVVVPPVFEKNRIMVMVRVQGLGDYLPEYAGNLDIINCAAIAVAEQFSRQLQ